VACHQIRLILLIAMFSSHLLMHQLRAWRNSSVVPSIEHTHASPSLGQIPSADTKPLTLRADPNKVLKDSALPNGGKSQCLIGLKATRIYHVGLPADAGLLRNQRQIHTPSCRILPFRHKLDCRTHASQQKDCGRMHAMHMRLTYVFSLHS